MSSLLRNSIFALGLVLILWLAYSIFFQNSDISSEGDQGGTLAHDSQELLARLRQLDQIKISANLFRDPRFQSLVDFHQEVQPEPIGRNNPFTPTDGSVTASAVH